jgi:hypothetical protein
MARGKWPSANELSDNGLANNCLRMGTFTATLVYANYSAHSWMVCGIYFWVSAGVHILRCPFLMHHSFLDPHVKLCFVYKIHNVVRNITRPEDESGNTLPPPRKNTERDRESQNKQPTLLEYSGCRRLWPTCLLDSVSCRLHIHQNGNKFSLAKLRKYANVLVESCPGNKSKAL